MVVMDPASWDHGIARAAFRDLAANRYFPGVVLVDTEGQPYKGATPTEVAEGDDISAGATGPVVMFRDLAGTDRAYPFDIVGDGYSFIVENQGDLRGPVIYLESKELRDAVRLRGDEDGRLFTVNRDIMDAGLYVEGDLSQDRATFNLQNGTGAPTGSGAMRLDQTQAGDITLSTLIRMTDSSAAAQTYEALYSSLQAGDELFLQRDGNLDAFARFRITGAATDNTGDWTIPLEFLAHGKSYSAMYSFNCSVIFFKNSVRYSSSGNLKVSVEETAHLVDNTNIPVVAALKGDSQTLTAYLDPNPTSGTTEILGAAGASMRYIVTRVLVVNRGSADNVCHFESGATQISPDIPVGRGAGGGNVNIQFQGGSNGNLDFVMDSAGEFMVWINYLLRTV